MTRSDRFSQGQTCRADTSRLFSPRTLIDPDRVAGPTASDGPAGPVCVLARITKTASVLENSISNSVENLQFRSSYVTIREISLPLSPDYVQYGILYNLSLVFIFFEY